MQAQQGRRGRWATRVGLLLVLSLTCGGCAQFRGIPSHGGGKRFDEEQRAVATAIRRTIAAMDLSELQGKHVLIQVTNLVTSGSGTTDFPGPNYVNAGVGMSQQDYNTHRETFEGITDEVRDAPTLFSGSLNYRISGSYRAANVSTEGDIAYFKAALDMKVRHCGINVVAKEKPDVVLNVLVDVLGINSSERDYFLATDDELQASCEVTYFAQNVEDGRLIFTARQTGARATYREQRIRLTTISRLSRDNSYAKPVFYAVDGKGRTAGPVDGVDLSSLPSNELAAKVEADPAARQDVLQNLYDRARFHIESGNADAARDEIEEIQKIDPGYRSLGALNQDVDRMTTP